MPSHAAARAIRHLLLVETADLGSMQPVLSHVREEEMGLRKVPPELVATTSGGAAADAPSCAALARESPWRHRDQDLFDFDSRREFGWSIFARSVRAHTIARKG